MPDKRTHRGAHPEDGRLFAAENIEILSRAVADYSLLLTKGYSRKSSLKLVGDHFSLDLRQRQAVMRASCSDAQLELRQGSRVAVVDIAGKPLAVDGYNLLITVESALGGGFLFHGRDGCFRDLASIHSTYRRVTETVPALEKIGSILDQLGTEDVIWYFDRPVSNSGRLAKVVSEVASKMGWGWKVVLPDNCDKALITSDRIVVSSDSDVLDKCIRWTNIMGAVLKSGLEAAVIDVSTPNQ